VQPLPTAEPVRREPRRAPALADFPLGAHLVTPRRGYVHHGIYVGEGRVVHYSGLSRSLRRGAVEEVTLAQFAGGRPVAIRSSTSPVFAPSIVVERARSRLGEDRYRIATNNCEHFCTWCLQGEGRSDQIDRFLRWPRVLAAALPQFAAAIRPAASRPGWV